MSPLRLATFLSLAGGVSAGQLPNLVIVLADDLGYGDPRCYQDASKIPTPSIDGLASEGMRFTDAHAPSSVCTPTRYGLLTGRYAWRTELQSSVLWPWDRPLIEPQRLTLPSILKSKGYATACIGKWHLGWDWAIREGAPELPELVLGSNNQHKDRALVGQWIDFTQPIGGGPLTRGFEHYYGDDVPNFPPYTFIEDDRVVAPPEEQKPTDMFGSAGPAAKGWDLSQVMPTLAQKASAWIDGRAQDRDQPFFLYMPLTAPHTPIAPLKRFAGMSEAGAYGDFVCEVDWVLGHVLAALERNGFTDNTIVIFTSDNGSPMRNGEGMSGPVGSNRRESGHDSSGGLRGLKSDIWEGGHRVPFIVRWPGHVEAGATSEALICLTDLYRTVAGVVGAQVPTGQGRDSLDIAAVWLGDATTARESIVHHSGNGTFAIRKGEWKLIVDNLGSGGFSRPARVQAKGDGPTGQLYCLSADPGEQENLYADKPEKVAELKALLLDTR